VGAGGGVGEVGLGGWGSVHRRTKMHPGAF
jgi:hypothetical protein